MQTCRMGETVDRSLLKHLLRMFSALGIYSESFERQFLDCTADFYAAEGTRFMQQTDVPDYLKHVEVSGESRKLKYVCFVRRKHVLRGMVAMGRLDCTRRMSGACCIWMEVHGRC